MLARISVTVCRQTLLKTSTISQKMSACRHIHLASQIRRTPKCISLLQLHKNHRIIATPFIRHASTDETSQTNPFEEIPDPPTPLQDIVENIVKVHPNGEATLESIGLGGWTPVGMVQNALEWMHISYDIPWWGTIVIGTLCVRILIFPLVIKSQRNMIQLTNHMPHIKELQQNMTEARHSGDHIGSARAATELMQYMKKYKVSPMKNFMVPLIQAPVFLSFFLALRKMANAPVESMKHGGFLWLQDLTVHDPYYIMPVLTCLTLYVTIEIGADGTNIKTMGIMRHVLRVVPFIILPFMIHFPGTILTYWASTNFVSLVQTGFLKIPRIRKALNMPVLVRPSSGKSIESNKNFTQEIKEAWTNMKITKQLSDRERADVVQFNTAGKGPIIKTFKYDPTKQKQSAILTKGR